MNKNREEIIGRIRSVCRKLNDIERELNVKANDLLCNGMTVSYQIKIIEEKVEKIENLFKEF